MNPHPFRSPLAAFALLGLSVLPAHAGSTLDAAIGGGLGGAAGAALGNVIGGRNGAIIGGGLGGAAGAAITTPRYRFRRDAYHRHHENPPPGYYRKHRPDYD